jgi:hypothetical protein
VIDKKKKKRGRPKKPKFAILFDESNTGRLPDPVVVRECEHENVTPVGEQGFIHWCKDCGALQSKPAGKWRLPKGSK